jgi:hypothetical protein
MRQNIKCDYERGCKALHSQPKSQPPPGINRRCTRTDNEQPSDEIIFIPRSGSDNWKTNIFIVGDFNPVYGGRLIYRLMALVMFAGERGPCLSSTAFSYPLFSPEKTNTISRFWDAIQLKAESQADLISRPPNLFE